MLRLRWFSTCPAPVAAFFPQGRHGHIEDWPRGWCRHQRSAAGAGLMSDPERLRIVADWRHGSSRAVSYFRRSVESEQIFDSSSEVSRSLQPPRRLSSGIRSTEQTACCPPAPSDWGSLTGGCDRSSRNQEQCTTYTTSGSETSGANRRAC